MVGTRLALVLLMEVVALWPSLAGAADYHHVHLTASNIEEAAQWYITHMGCQALSFRNDACRFGATQVNFLAREPTGGSQGSGLDHFGISFPDLAAKMDELEAAGIAVTMPLRDIPGLFKVGFVEDPWGTRIEVVEDPEYLGFHHVHLSSADPDAALQWYQEVFGGERRSLKGQLNGVLSGISILPAGSGPLLHQHASLHARFLHRTLRRSLLKPRSTWNRLEPPLSGHPSDTAPHRCSFFARRTSLHSGRASAGRHR